MASKLLLFDVDGTIATSGQRIHPTLKSLFNKLVTKGFHIGIVGGGRYEKIVQQLDGTEVHYIFSENGCVYHQGQNLIYTKNIRKHPLYPQINILIKSTLHFLSSVDYTITGHFIDLRNGLVYVSLIGLAATEEERQEFIESDKKKHYRRDVLRALTTIAEDLNVKDQVEIVEGGSVGIALYPREYDKTQVPAHLPNYDEICYFGDKYLPHGNDYQLLNHPRVTGYPVDCVTETIQHLESILATQ